MALPPKSAARAAPNIPEIDRILARAIQDKLCSGAVCLLSAPRGKGLTQLIHVGAQGHTRVGTEGKRVTKDTLFDVGSLTETLAVANLALMLTASGKLNLAATLGQVLPEASGGPLAAVPLASLLDHSSGLPAGDVAIAQALAALPPPVRLRAQVAQDRAAPTTARPQVSRDGVVAGAGPYAADNLAQLKKKLCHTTPQAAVGARQAHSALGPLLLGWAMEAHMGKPLDVLVRTYVVAPIAPAQGMQYVRNGPTGPLSAPAFATALKQDVAAASIICPWRGRLLLGEAQDRLTWALGGVAGHSGLFASGDATMRVVLGLLFSLQGLVRYAHAGTLSRFWTRSGQATPTMYTLGWQLACRDNGMLPGRWNSRSVGHVAPSGSALFIDPAFNVLGLLLTNLGHPDGKNQDAAWTTLRGKVFAAMASYGQNLSSPGKK